MRIYMQTSVSDDRPPRFYQLLIQEDLLEGWTLVREWGSTGGGGRTAREHFPSFQAAQEAMLKHRDAQVARGYKVMFIQGQEQPR